MLLRNLFLELELEESAQAISDDGYEPDEEQPSQSRARKKLHLQSVDDDQLFKEQKFSSVGLLLF